MAEKCMGLFDRKKLPDVASVEQVRFTQSVSPSVGSYPLFRQCCATGVTPEGKSPKTLVEEMVPLLDDRSVRCALTLAILDPSLIAVHSSVDKLRIIALYIMYRDGVPEGDKKRLYQHARLALHEMDAVDNLNYLGLNVDKVRYSGSPSNDHTADDGAAQDSGRKRKPLFKQKPEEDCYDISRYQPSMRFMLEVRLNLTIRHRSVIDEPSRRNNSPAPSTLRPSLTFATLPSRPPLPGLPLPPQRLRQALCGVLDLNGPPTGRSESSTRRNSE
jgi:syntaxin-binding protein 1